MSVHCETTRFGLATWLCAAVLSVVALVAFAEPAKPKKRGETYWAAVAADELFGVAGPDHVEVRLADGSRCDILTKEYAIEVDWADEKWKEAPGQAVLYAALTNRKPGVVLLVKNRRNEQSDILRATIVCAKLEIPIWFYEVKR